MAEKIFADGFSFKKKETAPDFVVGRLSIKAEEASEFIAKHSENGWLNININQAKSGGYYCELDTWKPTNEESKTPKTSSDEEPPF